MFQLIVNSSDRLSGSEGDYQVRLAGNATIPDGVTSMALQSVYMRNSIYTINRLNNKFYMSMRLYETPSSQSFDNTWFCEIPPGSYTVPILESMVGELISTSFASTFPGSSPITASVKHIASSGHYTVSVTSAMGRGNADDVVANAYHWFVVLDSRGDMDKGKALYISGFENTLNALFGFKDMTYPDAANFGGYIDTDVNEYESSRMESLSDNKSLLLCTDLVSGGTWLTGGYSISSVIRHIPLVPFGLSGFFEPANLAWHVTGGAEGRSSFRVWWVDPLTGLVPDLGSLTNGHSLVLIFK